VIQYILLISFWIISDSKPSRKQWLVHFARKRVICCKMSTTVDQETLSRVSDKRPPKLLMEGTKAPKSTAKGFHFATELPQKRNLSSCHSSPGQRRTLFNLVNASAKLDMISHVPKTVDFCITLVVYLITARLCQQSRLRVDIIHLSFLIAVYVMNPKNTGGAMRY